jgi:TatD DNase family protein
MLIDSHCHLDYFGDEADDVVARARAAGVTGMITIGTKLGEFAKVREIASRHPDVACTVGVHPHEAGVEGAAATTDRLVEIAADPKVAGIGETGLDYYYDHSLRTDQVAAFRAHIAAAQRTGLPLVVHTRDADDDTARILAEHHADKPLTGVIHCFSSGRVLAQRAMDIGFAISISGIVTFRKAEELRAVVRDSVPLERMLIETDAPYLAPVPHRGKRNEPAFVRHTAEAIAALKGVSLEDVMTVTSRNAARLFQRAPFAAAMEAGR